MSIKVLKHGQDTFRVICPKCGCEFEYGLYDLDCRDFISCPDCHKEILHQCPYVDKYDKYSPLIDLTKGNDVDTIMSYDERIKRGLYVKEH